MRCPPRAAIAFPTICRLAKQRACRRDRSPRLAAGSIHRVDPSHYCRRDRAKGKLAHAGGPDETVGVPRRLGPAHLSDRDHSVRNGVVPAKRQRLRSAHLIIAVSVDRPKAMDGRGMNGERCIAPSQLQLAALGACQDDVGICHGTVADQDLPATRRGRQPGSSVYRVAKRCERDDLTGDRHRTNKGSPGVNADPDMEPRPVGVVMPGFDKQSTRNADGRRGVPGA
jgi:hypothetical protein